MATKDGPSWLNALSKVLFGQASRRILDRIFERLHRVAVDQLPTILACCVIGSLVAVVGSIFRASGNQAQEELGTVVHRWGMGIMLVGFVGLLFRFGRSHQENTPFRWRIVDQRLEVDLRDPDSFVDLSEETLSASCHRSPQVSVAPSKIEVTELVLGPVTKVRCLGLRGRKMDESVLVKLACLRRLQVLDLQHATLPPEALVHLEHLESLELLLLHDCLEPAQWKSLRTALPVVRFEFQPISMVKVSW